MKDSINTNLFIKCCLCEIDKQNFPAYWNDEHIVPRGFGNDGKTDAVLEYKICKCCNQSLGDGIDKPFLRHVTTREIEYLHGMKRRKPKNTLNVSGSGIIVRYETSVAHLFECIKIAIETHIYFLSIEYRDNIFHALRILLLEVMEYCGKPKVTKSQIEIGHVCIASKDHNFQTIWNNVYRLDEISSNLSNIIANVEARSKNGSYASLIQLCCLHSSIFVLIFLQSLPPLAIRVSNDVDRYIKDYGQKSIHVMDLRSGDKWVGYENGD